MRSTILGTLVALWLCGLCAAVPCQPDRTPSQAADVFLGAWRKGDTAAMKAVALAEEPDPFLVAEDLWIRHLAANREKQPSPEFPGAAKALAELAAEKKAAKSLTSRVNMWPKLGADDRSLAWELSVVHARLNRLRTDRKWKELIAIARENETLIGRAAGMLAGVKIRIEIALAWNGLGKPATAAAEYEKAAELARQCDWPRAEGDALQWAGGNWRTAGNLAAACRAWQRELEIQKSAERQRRVAIVKMHLGSGYGQMRRLDKALPLLKQAAAELAELGDAESAALALGHLGVIHLKRHELDKATRYLQRARETLVAAGHDSWQIDGELGTVHQARGNIAEARACYRRAIAGAPADQPLRAAPYRGNLALLHIRAGEYDLAIKELKECARLHRSEGNTRSLAITYLSLGEAHGFAGQAKAALAWYDQAREAFDSIHDSRLHALALGGMADACRRLGRYDEALGYLRRAIPEMAKCGDRVLLARLQGTMGNIYMTKARFDRAISSYMRAMKSIEGLRAPRVRATTQNALAGAYYRVERLVDAARLAQRSLAGYRALGDHAGTGHALKLLGMISEKMGDWDRAESYLERSLEIFAGSNPNMAAKVRVSLSSNYLEASRFEEALAESLAAREVAVKNGDRWTIGFCDMVAGSAYLMLGKLEDAGPHLQRGLENLRAIGDGQNTASCLITMTRLHRRKGEYREAVACARRALAALHAPESGLADDERVGLRYHSRQAADHGLLTIHDRLGRKPVDAEAWWSQAFWFCETGRGMMLVEKLIDRKRVLDGRLPADLRAKVTAARAETRDALQATLAETRRERPVSRSLDARITDQLDDRYLAWRQVVAEIHRQAPRVGALLFPEPVALGAFRKHLPPDCAWIHYQLTADRALVLVVDHERVVLEDLGDSLAIDESVRSYLELARNAAPGATEVTLAARLYETLVKPIESVLAGKRRLLVSPDESMAFLPLEALVTRDREGREQRLIEKWAVTYAVSATAHEALAPVATAPAGRGFVAFGDPDYGPATVKALPTHAVRSGPLTPLPHSKQEVTRIARLYGEGSTLLRLGAEASVANFERAFAGRKGRLAAVHIACHGHVDSRRPLLTGLFLAGGEVLTLDAICQLDIAADLVVLSACNSNVSRVEVGEGTIGLVRGFFFAGCPRVVVSNWAVSDETTSRLMVSFYRKMIRDGLRPADALRAAKLEALRTKDTSAPYHWAPFVLWGRQD